MTVRGRRAQAPRRRILDSIFAGGSLRLRAVSSAALILLASALPALAGSVSGRILDSAGKPVAGARVAAAAYRNSDEVLLDETAGTEPAKIVETSTGPDGRFVLSFGKEALADALTSLRVQAAGHPGVTIAGPFDPTETFSLPDVTVSDPAKLSGRVVDAEGKPVAGALVRASALNGDVSDEAVDVAETRSRADGSFSLSDAVPPPRNLTVRAAGYALFWKNAPVAAEERLVLTRGGVVLGAVLDPAGKPAAAAIVRGGGIAVRTSEDGLFRLADVATGLQGIEAFWKEDFVARKSGLRVASGKEVGASLRLARAASIMGTVTEEGSRKPISGARLFAGESESFSAGGRSTRTARSDARGRFRLYGLAGRAYDVWARRPGFLDSRISAVATEVGTPGTANLALVRGATVAGKVVDEKGAPLVGARVRIEGGNSMRRLSRGRAASVTTADGTFRIRDLPSGRNLVVEAQKVGYGPGRRAGLSLKAGEALTGVTVVLRAGLEARGRVVDLLGNPISGAEVRLTKRENVGSGFTVFSGRPDRPDATTSADGGFVARGLEEADYSAGVSRDGFAPKTVQSLTVKSGVENVWRPITLPPGAALTGTVKSTAGAPVVAARVQWFPSGLGGGVVRDRAATTDVEGRFRLDGLAPGLRIQLTVSADGYASSSRNATPPADDVAVVLRTAGTVRGRVEDAEAKRPVPGFTVAIGVSQFGGGQSFFWRDWNAAGQPGQSDDGSFEIPNVTPGKVTVSASAPGFRPGEVTVEVAEGETKEGVVVSLRRGGAVSGRVLDGGRATPVANASVTWRTAGATTRGDVYGPNATNTDADGRFHFDGLPAGTVTVTARHPEYAEASKDVDPDKEGTVDVSLGAGAFVSGVVVGRDGRSPVSGASILLNGLGGSGNDTARTDDAGAFFFEHLHAGRFRLTARAAEGQAPPKDIVLLENERQEGVLLAIRAAGTRIRGTVTGLPPGQAGSMRVFANAKAWGDSTLTDDSGAFAFPDVPAGMVRLFATASSGASRTASRTVDVPDGVPELPVEIAFEGNSRLSGRVTRGERPVAGAWISAVPDPPAPNAPRSNGQTDENGRYSLEGLSDGQHIVAVSGQGISYQKIVSVSGDTAADVAIPAATIAGTVTDEASGDPIEGVHVQAETGRETSSSGMKGAVTDASGHYEISGMDPGTYQVTARKSGYQMRTRSATVASEAADASFTLARGTGVAIRVSDGTTGLPLRNVWAMAFASTGLVAFQGPVALDGSGKGEIPSLAPGPYSVYLFAGGFAPRSLPSLQAPSPEVPVVMTPGGRVEVRCDAPVSGRLTDAAGNVYLLGMGRIDGLLFAAPPIVAWENVAPGSYRFLVAGAAGQKTYALTVAEGQTSRLDLK